MHALAQGNVVIVGTCASANGSKVQVNLLASGRIPNGAQVALLPMRKASAGCRGSS